MKTNNMKKEQKHILELVTEIEKGWNGTTSTRSVKDIINSKIIDKHN